MIRLSWITTHARNDGRQGLRLYFQIHYNQFDVQILENRGTRKDAAFKFMKRSNSKTMVAKKLNTIILFVVSTSVLLQSWCCFIFCSTEVYRNFEQNFENKFQFLLPSIEAAVPLSVHVPKSIRITFVTSGGKLRVWKFFNKYRSITGRIPGPSMEVIWRLLTKQLSGSVLLTVPKIDCSHKYVVWTRMCKHVCIVRTCDDIGLKRGEGVI